MCYSNSIIFCLNKHQNQSQSTQTDIELWQINNVPKDSHPYLLNLKTIQSDREIKKKKRERKSLSFSDR